jgi:hypothetical protein
LNKARPKTAQEKLELRSLDSGPFNQKLSSFFDDKQEDMEKSGKNEYVLTSDEVEQIVPSEIKKHLITMVTNQPKHHLEWVDFKKILLYL